MSIKRYDDEEATNLVQMALSLNSLQPIYNVRVVNGEIEYLVCKPHEHALKDRFTGEWYDVIASDDAVVVATSRKTGKNEIIYQAGLRAFDVVSVSAVHTSEATGETDVPGIGSVYTHNNGNTYMVFGLGNLHAQEQNRAKYPITVLYVGANGFIWAKPVDQFLKSATLGGNFRFKDGIKLEYMGVSENDALQNGFMTMDLKALMEHTAREA